MIPRPALYVILGLLAVISACDQDVPGLRTQLAADSGAAVPPGAPRLRLRVSGNLEGYLKPCGCASGQMGGLGRRAFRNNIDARNIDLFLEGGNLSKKVGELELLKLYTALEVLSLGEHPYHAVGIGAKDLMFPRDELVGTISSFPFFVASDLVAADGKPWTHEGTPVAASHKEFTLEHVTVRVASLTMSLPAGDAGNGLALLPPHEGWTRALQGAAADTYRVAMIHAPGDAIKALDLQPKPDLIVSVNNDYVEPPPTAHATAAGVPLVFVGVHGRILLDVTVVRGPKGSMVTRYASVPLKGSQTAKDAMRDANAMNVIQAHRETVKEDGLLERLADKLALPGKATYVGEKRCAECHDTESDTCQKHAHSKAWQTLIDAEKNEGWPVTHYPECVSCHVVGYGYKSGFVNPGKTPQLLNVTCENCHGPGSEHSADEKQPIPVARPKPESCIECHNFEHSPSFEYNKYWKKIEHGR